MDLVQLRSFAHVAERGTVAAAAAALDFTPPAISQHVSKLEAELGTELFDRIGRRLTLSDAGACLLPIALELLDLETRGRRLVGQPSTTRRYVVAGFASAIAELVVPRLANLPSSMSLDIVESEDADALRELRLGTVDLVLTQEYDGMPVERAATFTFTPLLTDRLRLVLPAAMGSTTTIEDLAGTAWLVNGRGTRCAEATTRVLRRAGLAPVISGVVADNETLLALVAAGHGVTIVPEVLIDTERTDITVADQDLGICRTVLAVHRESSTDSIAPLLVLLQSDDHDVSSHEVIGRGALSSVALLSVDRVGDTPSRRQSRR